MVPMTLEMHRIMPKWMTLMPMLSAMGHRTGTSRTAMAVPSMKVPKISRMMATTRQNRVLFRFMETTSCTRAAEAPEKVNTQENAVEAAMMNRIMAALLADFIRMGIRSAILISL